MAGFRWYVAQALAGLEATAIYHLNRREGITAIAPCVTKDRAQRLYPGYVFVELSSPDEAGVVNRTRGIHKVLPIHAKSPLALPDDFIDGMRESIARGDFNARSEESRLHRFMPGDVVTPTDGAFFGHEGKFLHYTKGCGVFLCALLGREHALPIPLKSLALVAECASNGARGAFDRRVAA